MKKKQTNKHKPDLYCTLGADKALPETIDCCPHRHHHYHLEIWRSTVLTVSGRCE